MNEAAFFRSFLRPRLSEWGTYDRIENAIGSGLPDINYAIEGVQGWLEAKISHSGQRLFFEKFQLAWYIKRLRHTQGRGVWVIAANDEELWLYAASAMVAAPRTPQGKWLVVQQASLAPTVYGIKPWPWEKIKEALVS
jgi:hypothetical protein